MTIKIVWVTRSFLDYRIPVFRELSKLVNDNLFLVYSGDYVPESVQDKAKDLLGERCIPICGEWKLGREDQYFMANKNLSLRFQPGLIKKIRKINPDVIVCDGFFKWTLSALLYKLLHRTPIVINYERTHHTERNVQWYRTLYRKMVVKLTDAMDCSGQLCVDYTKSLGMPPERITTGHMSADTVEFGAKVEQTSQKEVEAIRDTYKLEGVVFLYVGRLHQRKGCLELINAWMQLEKQHSAQATLLLVGDGEQAEELKQFCDENDIHSIRFAGRIPYEQIAASYAAADIFVIPTLEDNWSLVVPEAMSAGLPILCSVFNGCWPELVKENINGWSFDPTDSAKSPGKLLLALAHKSELKEMGANSQRIISDYTPTHAAESVKQACTIALQMH